MAVKYFCDICRAEVLNPGWSPDFPDVHPRSHKTTTVGDGWELSVTAHRSSGASTHDVVCQKCLRDMLAKALAAFG
jgi:hypothetical protein